MNESERRLRLLSDRQTMDRLGLKPTAFRDRDSKGLIPPAVKINGRNFRPEHEIESLIRGHIRNLDDAGIRRLIADLIAQRAALEVVA